MTQGPVGVLLSRLEGVRKNGDRGWLARCPCHKDRTASLSIGEGRDGRVLVNCFGGCEVMDVLAAIGLEAQDLFPPRETKAMTRAEREELHARYAQVKWAAALDTLCQEATLVAIAANNVKNGIALSPEDLRRVNAASRRINAAKQVLSTGPGRHHMDQPFNPNRKGATA